MQPTVADAALIRGYHASAGHRLIVAHTHTHTLMRWSSGLRMKAFSLGLASQVRPAPAVTEYSPLSPPSLCAQACGPLKGGLRGHRGAGAELPRVEARLLHQLHQPATAVCHRLRAAAVHRQLLLLGHCLVAHLEVRPVSKTLGKDQHCS